MFRPVQDLVIPKGWQVKHLRQVCEATSTIDPSKSPEREVQYVDVSSVSNQEWVITTSTRHTGQTAPSRARKLVRTGDVIYATIRPGLKRVALIPPNLDGQVVSTAFCVLRADTSQVLPEFVYFWLLTDDVADRISKLERGASYPAVTDGDVLDLPILLPSISEQSRIVAALSIIQRAIVVESGIRSQLDALKSSLLEQLYREGLYKGTQRTSEVGNIPENWELVPLKQLIREPIRNGHSGPRAANGEGTPTLTLTAVTLREFSADHVKFSVADPERVKELWLQDGDVFIERANTREMVGLAALYRGPGKVAIFPDLLIRVRPDENKILADFLVEWLLLPWSRQYFQKHCKGAATNMPKIDHHVIENTLVPVPPPDEQEKIVQIIRALSERLGIARRKEARLREVFGTALEDLIHARIAFIETTEVAHAR